MKRNVMILMGALLVVSVSFASEQTGSDSVVYAVKGSSFVQKVNGEKHTIEKGLKLEAGDTVYTWPGSSVDVSFRDEMDMRIMPLSVLRIQKFYVSEAPGQSEGNVRVAVQLKSGNVVVDMLRAPKTTDFSIETPQGKVAPQGMQEVSYAENLGMQVKDMQGLVGLRVQAAIGEAVQDANMKALDQSMQAQNSVLNEKQTRLIKAQDLLSKAQKEHQNILDSVNKHKANISKFNADMFKPTINLDKHNGNGKGTRPPTPEELRLEQVRQNMHQLNTQIHKLNTDIAQANQDKQTLANLRRLGTQRVSAQFHTTLDITTNDEDAIAMAIHLRRDQDPNETVRQRELLKREIPRVAAQGRESVQQYLSRLLSESVRASRAPKEALDKKLKDTQSTLSTVETVDLPNQRNKIDRKYDKLEHAVDMGTVMKLKVLYPPTKQELMNHPDPQKYLDKKLHSLHMWFGSDDVATLLRSKNGNNVGVYDDNEKVIAAYKRHKHQHDTNPNNKFINYYYERLRETGILHEPGPGAPVAAQNLGQYYDSGANKERMIEIGKKFTDIISGLSDFSANASVAWYVQANPNHPIASVRDDLKVQIAAKKGTDVASITDAEAFTVLNHLAWAYARRKQIILPNVETIRSVLPIEPPILLNDGMERRGILDLVQEYRDLLARREALQREIQDVSARITALVNEDVNARPLAQRNDHIYAIAQEVVNATDPRLDNELQANQVLLAQRQAELTNVNNEIQQLENDVANDQAARDQQAEQERQVAQKHLEEQQQELRRQEEEFNKLKEQEARRILQEVMNTINKIHAQL